MLTTNQTFPYTEESLTIQFSPRETAADIVAYLAINGYPASVVTTTGAVVAKPEEYEGDMLIQWIVPKLDADGNEVYTVVDGVSVLQTYTITTPWFNRDASSIDLNIPVGAILKTLNWLEPELQAIPIRWITNKGQKYFPITHVDAVIDANGNKMSSVIEWCREEVEDAQDRMDSLERKLLKEVTSYGTLATSATADANGYKASDLVTLYLDDTLAIPEDASTPGRKVTLVKEDGTVIGQYTLPLDYTCTEDAAFYIYTDSPLTTGVNYTTVTLSSRSGSGSDVSFLESNSMLTITDNDNAKVYQVAKANTLVKADNVTIKAVTSADGITKTINVADEYVGTVYDKTTGALRSVSLNDTNNAEGSNSVALGFNNKTSNTSEATVGQFNVSHDNSSTDAKTVWYGDNVHTAFSVGAGLAATNRFNAIEIMQDGTLYIKGVGNYDGKNLSVANLKSLQDVVNASQENELLIRQIQILKDAIASIYAGNTDEIELTAQPVVSFDVPEITNSFVYHGVTTVNLTKISVALDGTTDLTANSASLVLETTDTTMGTVTTSDLATGFDLTTGDIALTATFDTAVGKKYAFRLKYEDADNTEYSYLAPKHVSCDKAVNPFYVGQIDGTKADFAATAVGTLTANASQYQYVDSVDTVVDKYIYYVLLPDGELELDSITFVDGPLSSKLDETSMNCTHADVTIGGLTYKVYAYRIAPDAVPLTYTLKVK